MGAQWKHAGRTESANARSKVYSKMAKEIIIAAKGGADLNNNARLRMVVDAAKKASVPKDTIERAIKKGAGLLDETVQYDNVTYEGFGPHRVPIIVECLTDNRNRTATSVRVLFRKGQLGNVGTVSWDFQHVGIIEASPEAGAPDADTAAIESGAQDLESADGGATRFFTEPTDLDAVGKALIAQKWSVASSVVGWRPKNLVKVDDAAARAEVIAFLEALDEDDDVQNIYTAFDPS